MKKVNSIFTIKISPKKKIKKMKLIKTHPVLSIANSFFIDSPLPSNITYLWNFGSLLGLCLVIQIVTGVTLAMHYAPSTSLAFVSVEHIYKLY